MTLNIFKENADFRPLIKAIDAYLKKADEKLADALDDAGFISAEETVEEIGVLEEALAGALKRQTRHILDALESVDELQEFADSWDSVKLLDDCDEYISKAFYESFNLSIPELVVRYIAEIDPELASSMIHKSFGSKKTSARITKRLMAWVRSWSMELGKLMKLSTHTMIEMLLAKNLAEGKNVTDFTLDLMGYQRDANGRILRDKNNLPIRVAGIRDEYYRARRVAQTEMLTAHSAAKQEAFLQSPTIETKMWRHVGSHRSKEGAAHRENHVAMDRQRVPKNEPFKLEGKDGEDYEPMFPRDPENLSAGERINCRCGMQGIISDDDNIFGMTLEEREALQQQAIDEDNDKWDKYNERWDLGDADRAIDDANGAKAGIEVDTAPTDASNFTDGQSSGNIGETIGETVITEVTPIDFNDTDAVAQEIEQFCNSFAFANVEHAIEISPTNQAYHLIGNEHTVDSGIIGAKAMSGSIGVHNHTVQPGQTMGDSFSRKDLYFAAEHSTGLRLLVSGERRNAFEFTKPYTDKEIYTAWKKADNKMMEAAFVSGVDVNWWYEGIMKILNEDLEGFEFYENF